MPALGSSYSKARTACLCTLSSQAQEKLPPEALRVSSELDPLVDNRCLPIVYLTAPCLASVLEGRICSVGEFLRKRKRILQTRGKFLIHKKCSNKFSMATDKKNTLFRPEGTWRNMLGPMAITSLVPTLEEVDLAEGQKGLSLLTRDEDQPTPTSC